MSESCSEKTIKKLPDPAVGYTPELANSDRIRLKFGDYGIEVLESGPRIRVSSLYSVEAGIRTNRTFAVVAYPSMIESAFSNEHHEILSGQSIGIVFRNNGWAISKRHQYFGRIGAHPNQAALNAVFGGIGEAHPAIHIYSLFVRKDGEEYPYASIAEVHHPDYLDLEDLAAIYGSEYDTGYVKNGRIDQFLDIVETKMRSV